MRLRNVSGSRELIAESDYVIHDATGHKGHWGEVFGNGNPIHIEVGMGKGKFITQLAKQNPDINYIGIEKYSSVLLRAVEKRREYEGSNLLFIRMDAEYISDVFDKDEISRIYLNFSDPWPKERHARRRLTSREFLARYEEILADGGLVEFKTDNRSLFDFSLEEVKESGWELLVCTYDLHHDKELMEGNVMTEYERKFSNLRNPIHKLVIRKPNRNAE